MLPEHVQAAIKSAFSLEHMGCGHHNDYGDSGKTKERFRVHAMWAVVLEGHYFRTLTLTGVYRSVWVTNVDDEVEDYRGLLLIPSTNNSADTEFLGGEFLKPVDLEWPGVLVSALASINALPYFHTLGLDSPVQSYEIFCYTMESKCTFKYRGSKPQTPNMEQLDHAISETINTLAENHNIEEIKTYLSDWRNLSRD